MTQLFTRNSKLKKAEYNTVNFGIPALKTCPEADKCKSFCYATKGAFRWPSVKAAYEYRYQQTRKADFIEVATSTLKKKAYRTIPLSRLLTLNAKGKTIEVR